MRRPFRYSYQNVTESGSFTNDSLTYHARTKNELDCALSNWEAMHSRVGSDPEYAQLYVWYGCYNEQTVPEYPDAIAYRGPRGGFNIISA